MTVALARYGPVDLVALNDAGISYWSMGIDGGNMEGKDVRFGIDASALLLAGIEYLVESSP